MQDKNTGSWIEGHRFTVVAILLVLIWGSLFAFYWLKTDEITKDPCSICSKNMGENVVCTTQSLVPVQRTYHTNGTITDDRDEVVARQRSQQDAEEYNFSIGLDELEDAFGDS